MNPEPHNATHEPCWYFSTAHPFSDGSELLRPTRLQKPTFASPQAGVPENYGRHRKRE
ncbi:Uncharacterised protein [Afipia felis]|uniref:Uncharacterized protein n=2 Tax=Afipia felis TaxID=1035 RepID=A0A380WBV7_AFIFE|nr:hypothetical protein HMPREF9697_02197 [Afipia felis ATCC 53690]SUU78376.1 Uncharacterised protein [Afipia felis]SUU86441.1 Uncharacterised protein [Afipia felis]